MNPEVLLSLLHDLQERCLALAAQVAQRDQRIAQLEREADPPDMPPSNQVDSP